MIYYLFLQKYHNNYFFCVVMIIGNKIMYDILEVFSVTIFFQKVKRELDFGHL